MARKDSQSPERIDRLPPHSMEAEQGVLGCILLNPTECMMQCVQHFPGPEVFYTIALRTVYQLLCVMHDAREPMDLITVQQRLRDKGQLEAIGGLGYLSSLQDGVPSAANIDYYIPIVFEKFKLRSLVHTCTEIIGRVYDNEETAAEGIEDMQRDIIRTAQMSNRKGDWSVKGALRDALKDIEADIKSGGALTGLPTGYPDLDSRTRGLQRGEFIVIGARPSFGKSTLVMNLADHWAVNCKIPVGVFSVEMSKKSLMRRMISARSRINLFQMDKGLSAQNEARLSRAVGQLAPAPLYIDDTPGIDDVQLRSGIRQMVHEHGIQAVVVDYFQLLHTRKRFDNRVLELSSISTNLKTLFRELNIAGIMVAQLNREADTVMAKGERPKISHLKDCGTLEQDADLIGLLYAIKLEDYEESHIAVPSALDIAKQRNGPIGPIPLTFCKSIFRFESSAKINSEDVPQQPGMGI